MLKLDFRSGTLLLSGTENIPPQIKELFCFDPRTGSYRAKAYKYAEIVLALRSNQIKFIDAARDYELLSDLDTAETIVPRDHQSRALAAWCAADCRGVVSLPTGSGKTILAVMAIAKLKRPTLILVPTIDLLTQWCSVLERFFNRPVGMLGGGSHRLENITVSTYDSAALNIEFIGSRFALLIADECHHLPAPCNVLTAEMAIAPFRLGLSATPELDGPRTALLDEVMGRICFETAIDELEGSVLSDYRVIKVRTSLTPEEQNAYLTSRRIYTGFLRRYAIIVGSGADWGRFLIACARYPGGKEALQAFTEQRRIARNGTEKFEKLRQLLREHRGERIIIFTADNDTAYSIGRKFVLPVLTHHTKAAERKDFLDCFRDGTYPVLVTSKVLNEGVDVPAAAVGIIVSGSASVREHVQRLGRILRPAPGKVQALLYELVSADTGEENISERRRAHRAYRRRY